MTKPFRFKPAVSWPGGKSRLVDELLPLVPPHDCYVEPFAGGIALLLAKPRSKLEVLNDVNGDLVNFYRCVRFHTDSLLTELEFVLNSREEFDDFRRQPGLTDIQRAARWYYRNKNCFGGDNMNSFGTGALSGGGAHGSREARMEVIRLLNLRLDRTVIESEPWEKCVERYDRGSTFFFLDPPYVDGHMKMYSAWHLADVVSLRERLARIKGRWMVTLNDSPTIRSVFAGCNFATVTRKVNIDSRNPAKDYRELIIVP